MPSTLPNRAPHNTPTSMSSPSLMRRQFILSLFSLFLIVLCALPLCSSRTLSFSSSSASSTLRSASSMSSTTSPPDVWRASPSSITGRTDVWPPMSTAGDYRPIPDQSSHLHCEALELLPQLAYNQSVLCIIECKLDMSPAAGQVSDYEWSADEMNGDFEAAAAASAASSEQLRSAWVNRQSSNVKFGSVSNFTYFNDSKFIAFMYTAPSTGSVGILHVLAGPRGAEIENSPVMFELKAPPSGENSTTPVTPPPTPTTQSSTPFVSLSNPAFLAVCAVAAVVLLAALLGGVWARRVFTRKADEVRERQASEAQWAHSVPSLKARLDRPQPSSLRSPLL